MKIGVVVDQLLPGGVQIVAIREVKELNRLGIKAELLILMRKKYSFHFQDLVKDIPYCYLSDKYPWPLRNTIKFPIFAFFSTLHLLSPFLAPKVINKKAYDLLISHGTTTCFTSLALWRKNKIPYLAVVHDPIIFILKKVYSKTFLRFFFPIFIPLSFHLEKAFVKAAVSTIIVSKVHQKFIRRHYQVKPVILAHGCDVAGKTPLKRGGSILAISRWQKEKNPEFLLKLLGKIPGVKLIIAGNWTQETELISFKNQVKKLKLEKRVEIIPQFTTGELKKLCRRARVWVHPHFEAFGLGGLEAAAHGVPIIIPAGSGITDLFQNKVHGFFPKKISVKEYKKYISLLLTNERLAYKMGQRAWLKIKKEFSWSAHTRKLLDLARSQPGNLYPPVITAIEIGHAGGTGLAGGDRILEEMVKRMPKKYKIEVITSPYGSRHWQESQTQARLHILPPNPFEEKPDPVSVFLTYCLRMIQTSLSLLKNAKKLAVLYSSTNVLPDILPGFITKLANPKVAWLARVHHLVPPPRQREGKLIVNIVSYWMQKIALACIRSKADLVIVLNETLRQYLSTIGFRKKKLAVLGGGIDFERINRYQPQKTESFDGIYLGRLHVAKGIFDTVDIWKQVVEHKKKARLGIIGAGPEEIKKELISKIKKNNLTDNIKIFGYLPENRVYDFLKSAKVFLFTDHEAGWGLAVAEAMACRLPVIGFDTGVLGDVFKKGYLIAPCFNRKLFGQKTVSLLTNEKKRKRLAKEAFAQAKELSWQKTTRKFTRLLIHPTPVLTQIL